MLKKTNRIPKRNSIKSGIIHDEKNQKNKNKIGEKIQNKKVKLYQKTGQKFRLFQR